MDSEAVANQQLLKLLIMQTVIIFALTAQSHYIPVGVSTFLWNVL